MTPNDLIAEFHRKLTEVSALMLEMDREIRLRGDLLSKKDEEIAFLKNKSPITTRKE